MALPKNKALKQFNSYLEEVRGKLARHYRELQMKGERLTAAAVKDAYVGTATGAREVSASGSIYRGSLP